MEKLSDVNKGNFIADLSINYFNQIEEVRKKYRRKGKIFILFSLFCPICIIIGYNESWSLPFYAFFPYFGLDGIANILISKTPLNMEIYENGILLPTTQSLSKRYKRERDFIQFTDIIKVYINKYPDKDYITIKTKNWTFIHVLKKLFDIDTFINICFNYVKISHETRISLGDFFIK